MSRFRGWSNYHKSIVKNAERNIGLCIAVGSGSESKITCNVSDLLTKEYKLVISYRSNYNFFVVWPTELNFHKARTQFAVGQTYQFRALIGRGVGDNAIIPYYKEVKGEDSYLLGYQKILLVGANRLQDVIEHYEEYIFPSQDDEGYIEPICAPDEKGVPVFRRTSEDTPQALLKADITRAKDYISRTRRDYRFHRLVLERWNNRCAVCGETELIVLQAAHIIAVKDGGSDEPNNGICLCANHHLMFDGENGMHLITISEDQRTFSCSSTSEKKKEWYIQAKARGLTLFPSRY